MQVIVCVCGEGGVIFKTIPVFLAEAYREVRITIVASSEEIDAVTTSVFLCLVAYQRYSENCLAWDVGRTYLSK